MAIHIMSSKAGCPPLTECYVHDDRRQLYLNAGGRWQVVPWCFASYREAADALRVKNEQDALAIR